MNAPEITEDYHNLPECRLRIGTRHDLVDPMQTTALGHVVEHGFELRSPRSKLIVNGKPRHSSSHGHRVERNAITCGQHRACGLEQTRTRPLRCHGRRELRYGRGLMELP